MSEYFFQFKSFKISQTKNAHKVGTDSVILGSFIRHFFQEKNKHINSILDIGTGTGILAIMSASIFPNAQIKAVEINKSSSIEAQKNVADNQLSDKIEIIHSDINRFIPDTTFDIIISNPPYYTTMLLSQNKKRATARHATKLTFNQLICFANNHLSAHGYLCLVLPTDTYTDNKINFLETLWLQAELTVFPKYKATSHITCIILSKNYSNHIYKKQLTIRETNGNYTETFKNFTNAFYLPQVFKS